MDMVIKMLLLGFLCESAKQARRCFTCLVYAKLPEEYVKYQMDEGID